MRTTAEIAWLAGLIEGEGYFVLGTGRHTSITLGIGMTDKDVIDRARGILGVRTEPYVASQRRGKPIYRLVCSGPLSAGWAMTLYGFMGARRREKIRDCLAHWRSRKGRGSTIHLALAKRWPNREVLGARRRETTP